MLEQAILSEQFEALLDSEQQAMKTYADLAKRAADPRVAEEIRQILREKQRHVDLIQRLLEIVE